MIGGHQVDHQNLNVIPFAQLTIMMMMMMMMIGALPTTHLSLSLAVFQPVSVV
ncbi:MAG: hypothetical protein WCA23_31285 [Stellaceae bacterium]